MSLRDKYNHAIQTAKGFKMEGAAEERDGKLYFKGTVNTQDEPTRSGMRSRRSRLAEGSRRRHQGHRRLRRQPLRQHSSRRHKTYTVKSGDTLSKIAKEHLGDANAYMDIFNANRDQLTDPNMIKPGQVLKIPEPAHK